MESPLDDRDTYTDRVNDLIDAKKHKNNASACRGGAGGDQCRRPDQGVPVERRGSPEEIGQESTRQEAGPEENRTREDRTKGIRPEACGQAWEQSRRVIVCRDHLAGTSGERRVRLAVPGRRAQGKSRGSSGRGMAGTGGEHDRSVRRAARGRPSGPGTLLCGLVADLVTAREALRRAARDRLGPARADGFAAIESYGLIGTASRSRWSRATERAPGLTARCGDRAVTASAPCSRRFGTSGPGPAGQADGALWNGPSARSPGTPRALRGPLPPAPWRRSSRRRPGPKIQHQPLRPGVGDQARTFGENRSRAEVQFAADPQPRTSPIVAVKPGRRGVNQSAGGQEAGSASAGGYPAQRTPNT